MLGDNMKICITGHRPDKLYGYDLSDKRYMALSDSIIRVLIDNHCDEFISGMALGVDTVGALSVIRLKHRGNNIKLHCAIPCRNHSSKWNKESVKMYKRIIKTADIVNVVCDEEYKPYVMQKRNEYMVDLSDIVIAVFDGSPGGTKNCIEYAKKMDKKIIYINPKEVLYNG